MLIYAQNPGALFVGSFAAIKKITDELAKEHKLPNGELPYYGIKKGAKAIKIFVPQKITYLKTRAVIGFSCLKQTSKCNWNIKRVTLKATKGLDSA